MSNTATTHTSRFNEQFVSRLPAADSGWEDAGEGLIARFPRGRIVGDAGETVFDVEAHGFLEAEASPSSANPSLWRLSRLNALHGLFRVADRIYQIRGIDISNMTIVLGDSGYIVIDPLLSVETARAGLALVREHLGEKPITGIVYTHCHLDHFGGVGGILAAEEISERRVPVVAPAGFVQHAINENLYSGAAEARRNAYMFGALLPAGPTGHITSGIGVGTSTGTSTLIAPTVTVQSCGLDLMIDGVEFEFTDASGAEAPSEMHFSLPQFGAVCLAENATQVMHNLYTLRGAPVRDALLWCDALDTACEMYGGNVEIAFMSHHWPIRGRERIREFLTKQRDMYRFIHDETLRLANHGYRPDEIAELIELPDSLARFWPNRGTYGSLKVNARAVYQKYLGWFDGNPANLDPLPPREAGGRYVAALGGSDQVILRAREAYAEGDYRWAAELLSHLLSAEPENTAAAVLQADVFEQLGYQSEAATWRNFYLSAAQELRAEESEGSRETPPKRDFGGAMSTDMLMDYLAIRFNGMRGSELRGRIVFEFSDRDERWIVEIGNGVLNCRAAATADEVAECVDIVRLTAADFGSFAQGTVGLDEISNTGRSQLVEEFIDLLDTFSGSFSLVFPREGADIR